MDGRPPTLRDVAALVRNTRPARRGLQFDGFRAFNRTRSDGVDPDSDTGPRQMPRARPGVGLDITRTQQGFQERSRDQGQVDSIAADSCSMSQEAMVARFSAGTRRSRLVKDGGRHEVSSSRHESPTSVDSSAARRRVAPRRIAVSFGFGGSKSQWNVSAGGGDEQSRAQLRYQKWEFASHGSHCDP